TVRAHIRATPAAEGIEINIAGAFDFPRQLDAELEHAVGQQWNMAYQAQALGGNIDNITDGFAGLAVVNAEVVTQMMPFDYPLFSYSLFHNPRTRSVGRQADQKQLTLNSV